MSELIAAKAKGELLERYQQQLDLLDEDTTESELIRELLGEGLDAREAPLFARIDLPDGYAARVEAERAAGESDEELLRRLLRDTVDGWDEDVLDEIGASDELRERVEADREEGETLAGAVDRLLRRGLGANTGPPSLRWRVGTALATATIGGLFVGVWETAGPAGVVIVAVFVLAYLAVYPHIDAALGRAKNGLT